MRGHNSWVWGLNKPQYTLLPRRSLVCPRLSVLKPGTGGCWWELSEHRGDASQRKASTCLLRLPFFITPGVEARRKNTCEEWQGAEFGAVESCLTLARLSERVSYQPPSPLTLPGPRNLQNLVRSPCFASNSTRVCVCVWGGCWWGCGGESFQILPNSVGYSSSCHAYDIITKTCTSS